MTVPIFAAITPHGAHVIRGIGGNAEQVEELSAERVKNRRVIIVPSAAKPGAERRAARRLQSLGAEVCSVPASALFGALDLADLIEQRGDDVDLEAIARASMPLTTATERGGGSVELLRGSDVKPEPIDWIWNGWLARGKLHMLAGAPGTGKTTLSLALAAAITRGGRFPDGTRAAVGTIAIWSGEDDAKDVIAPRLIMAGADMLKVWIVGRTRDEGGQRAGPRKLDRAISDRTAPV